METQQVLDDLCEEYKDIFSSHKGDIDHTKLHTMNIDKGNHPPIVQKPYTLQLKPTQWVQEELEMLQNIRIILQRLSPWSSPIVTVPKNAQSRYQH